MKIKSLQDVEETIKCVAQIDAEIRAIDNTATVAVNKANEEAARMSAPLAAEREKLLAALKDYSDANRSKIYEDGKKSGGFRGHGRPAHQGRLPKLREGQKRAGQGRLEKFRCRPAKEIPCQPCSRRGNILLQSRRKDNSRSRRVTKTMAGVFWMSAPAGKGANQK